MTETRTCESCKGTGIRVREAFTYNPPDGGKPTHYPRSESPCYSCDGKGSLGPLDVAGILAKIKGRKGLRTSPPTDQKDKRAYYVWRLARFHGGRDVTMPITATLRCSHDPYRKELDDLADAVAKRAFGTDLAAAHRWGRALGHINRDLPGLPSSAYQGGPEVLDGEQEY